MTLTSMRAWRVAAAGLLMAAALPVAAQDQKPAMTPEQQKMMEAWMKAMTPGPPHQHLAETTGKWKMTMTTWDAPGAPPQTSTGTSEMKMILGGRFLQQEAHGTAMGQPFDGFGLTGYDNASGEFQSIWMDSMGTGMAIFTGKGVTADHVITMHGSATDPMTGKPMKMRSVTRILSKDRHVFEMYTPGPDGKEMKMMEIVYERL